MKKFLAIALLSATLSAHATPTYSEVEDALARGDMAQAKVMMVEVMKKRPESLRAQKLNAVVEGVSADVAIQNAPVEKSNVFRNIFGAVCVAALAVAGFMLYQYYAIWKRSKFLKKAPVVSSPVVAEIDKANYSTQLTTHSV